MFVILAIILGAIVGAVGMAMYGFVGLLCALPICFALGFYGESLDQRHGR